MDLIKIQRALHLKDDEAYRSLILNQSKFSSLAVANDTNIDDLKKAGSSLNELSIKMETIIRQAALNREAKSSIIQQLSESTNLIQTENEERVTAIDVLNLEAKQAKEDMKAINSLQHLIERTLRYPSLTELNTESNLVKGQLSDTENKLNENDEYLQDLRNKISTMLEFIDDLSDLNKLEPPSLRKA